MELEEKYELGEVLANDAESKTFRARDLAAGRDVLVHLLFGGRGSAGQEPILASLLQRMVDPSPERRRPILEISDYKGLPYAVTELLPGFRTLRAWVDQDRPAPAAPPATAEPDRLTRAGRWRVPALDSPGTPPPSQPEGPPAKPAGEFTRLFRVTVGETQKLAVPQPPAAAPPSAPPVAPPPAVAPPAPATSSRLFGEPPAAPPPAVAPPPPATSSRLFSEPLAPAPAEPSPAAPGPGEFTRLFQQPPATGGLPEKVEPCPPAAGPGEFTRSFQQPLGNGPLGEPVQGGGGDFERLFQQPIAEKPSLPETPAAPPAPGAKPPGEFTRLFQAMGNAPPPPVMPAPPGGAPAGDFESWLQPPAARNQPTPVMRDANPISAPPSGGPGEFTRLFGASARPGEPVSKAPSAPPPPVSHSGATSVFSAGPVQQAPPPPAASGPGEYTRLFGTPSPGVPPPAAPPPMPVMSGPPQMAPPPMPAFQAPAVPQAPPLAVPAVAAKPSNLPLYLLLGLVVLCLIGLVLYFVLKK